LLPKSPNFKYILKLFTKTPQKHGNPYDFPLLARRYPFTLREAQPKDYAKRFSKETISVMNIF
ncbi:MAG: hypothetical protein ACFNT6_09875, partial [Neisseria sp.]|uniref:hypothetical protein n=1 Tax=Neisseria sp. TaxID=192066 RepID=UPI0036077036